MTTDEAIWQRYSDEIIQASSDSDVDPRDMGRFVSHTVRKINAMDEERKELKRDLQSVLEAKSPPEFAAAYLAITGDKNLGYAGLVGGMEGIKNDINTLSNLFDDKFQHFETKQQEKFKDFESKQMNMFYYFVLAIAVISTISSVFQYWILSS